MRMQGLLQQQHELLERHGVRLTATGKRHLQRQQQQQQQQQQLARAPEVARATTPARGARMPVTGIASLAAVPVRPAATAAASARQASGGWPVVMVNAPHLSQGPPPPPPPPPPKRPSPPGQQPASAQRATSGVSPATAPLQHQPLQAVLFGGEAALASRVVAWSPDSLAVATSNYHAERIARRTPFSVCYLGHAVAADGVGSAGVLVRVFDCSADAMPYSRASHLATLLQHTDHVLSVCGYCPGHACLVYNYPVVCSLADLFDRQPHACNGSSTSNSSSVGTASAGVGAHTHKLPPPSCSQLIGLCKQAVEGIRALQLAAGAAEGEDVPSATDVLLAPDYSVRLWPTRSGGEQPAGAHGNAMPAGAGGTWAVFGQWICQTMMQVRGCRQAGRHHLGRMPCRRNQTGRKACVFVSYKGCLCAGDQGMLCA